MSSLVLQALRQHAADAIVSGTDRETALADAIRETTGARSVVLEFCDAIRPWRAYTENEMVETMLEVYGDTPVGALNALMIKVAEAQETVAAPPVEPEPKPEPVIKCDKSALFSDRTFGFCTRNASERVTVEVTRGRQKGESATVEVCRPCVGVLDAHAQLKIVGRTAIAAGATA